MTQSDGRGPVVLLVDDDAAIRRSVAEGLELEGFHVVPASGGRPALVAAETASPDVILLDLSMPVRTGLDALPEIKTVAPRARVLVFTGLTGSLVEEAVRAAGADGFIGKHASPGEIVEAILSRTPSRV